MIDRTVEIDGRLYYHHELVLITSNFVDNETIFTVASSNNDETIERSTSIEYVDGLTRSQAETVVWQLPNYEEYIDPNEEILNDILELLTDDQAETIPQAFPEWTVNVPYAVGKRVRYNNKLYRCVQAHISQVGWEPDATAALWVRTAQDDEIPEWTQPTGAHDAYSTGDKVTHNNKTWISTIDANVYEPGVYGWNEVS